MSIMMNTETTLTKENKMNPTDYVSADGYTMFRFRAEKFGYTDIREADPGEILRARWEYAVLRADRTRPSKGKK